MLWWGNRDDLELPTLAYSGPIAQGGQGPPLMLAEWFQSVITQLFQQRIIRCGGTVDDDMANLIVAQLLYLDAADPNRDIVMYIDSPGGSVTAVLWRNVETWGTLVSELTYSRIAVGQEKIMFVPSVVSALGDPSLMRSGGLV
jgi:hypothetical protein